MDKTVGEILGRIIHADFLSYYMIPVVEVLAGTLAVGVVILGVLGGLWAVLRGFLVCLGLGLALWHGRDLTVRQALWITVGLACMIGGASCLSAY